MAVITNVTELQNMTLDGTHELGNDIDASATSGWNAGAGFVPIAPYHATPFTGSFDGKGYTISGLYINRDARAAVSYGYNIGLFGVIEGATIHDVKLTGLDLTGYKSAGTGSTGSVGGLAAIDKGNSVISDCSTAGSVFANDINFIGGLMAWNGAGTTMADCWSSCTVDVIDRAAGGFIAINYATIERCYATGAITSDDDYAGAFCYSNNGTIRQSYASGVTSTAQDAAGFAAFNYGTIEDCYALGNATSTGAARYAAGFVVWNYDTISDSYSIGAVIGNTMGGFCGENDGGTITDCFWDTQTSGQATSDGGTGKTTAQMKQVTTFSDWDIRTSTTDLNNSYPYLAWQLTSNSPVWYIYEELVTPVNTDVTIVALEALRNIEMSAMGRIYVDEEGNLCYENRYSRQL